MYSFNSIHSHLTETDLSCQQNTGIEECGSPKNSTGQALSSFHRTALPLTCIPPSALCRHHSPHINSLNSVDNQAFQLLISREVTTEIVITLQCRITADPHSTGTAVLTAPRRSPTPSHHPLTPAPPHVLPSTSPYLLHYIKLFLFSKYLSSLNRLAIVKRNKFPVSYLHNKPLLSPAPIFFANIYCRFTSIYGFLPDASET